MSMPIIRAESLKKTFVVSGRTIVAVDDVSFSLEVGTTLGLVGQSGSGKSTIGKMLVGLCPPSAGKIFYRDRDITVLPKGERRKLAPRIQMVFQNPYASLNPSLTVEEILTDGIRYHGLLAAGSSVKARAVELLDIVELPQGILNRYPHELSGGQCQRIGIARALSLQPELLICDEITSALDVNVQAQILNLLLRLQQQFGLSCLFISHDIGIVRHMSDSIAVLRHGVIVEYGPSAQVCQQARHPYTRQLLNISL